LFELTEHKSRASLLLAVLLLTGAASAGLNSLPVVYSAASIELAGFRWYKFPLRILVDMNQWSRPEYAVAVHEALSTWSASIWAYIESFNDNTLHDIRFDFYVSDINATNDYDVRITFEQHEIPPDPNTVGMTVLSYNPATHEPTSSAVINITTFSKTADSLFVKNVAMHEMGHVLGLKHAASASTSDGPELMYASSSKNQVFYPSTLDMYGLIMLYKGSFDRSIQLPTSIPYRILSGVIQYSATPPKTDENVYGIVLIAAAAILVVGLVLAKIARRKKPAQAQNLASPDLQMQGYAL
jgi:predicted Zn-dependent protease